MSLKMMIW